MFISHKGKWSTLASMRNGDCNIEYNADAKLPISITIAVGDDYYIEASESMTVDEFLTFIDVALKTLSDMLPKK